MPTAKAQTSTASTLLGASLRLSLVTAGLLAAAAATGAAAQSTTPSRDEFQKTYKSQLQNNPSLFDTAPIYHIVPSENNITFAAAANYIDVTVGPVGSDTLAKRTNMTSRLDYTGWSGTPYVAFSGKNFAIGLTGAVGGASSHFLRRGQAADLVNGTPAVAYQEQFSTLSYSGVGLFLYYSPTWLLPKQVTPTLVIGGNSLSAIQNETGSLYDRVSQAPLHKYRYSVLKGTAGLNVGIHLAKRAMFIPWIDYSNNRVTRPQTDNSATSEAADVDPALQQNLDLYWHTEPTLRYGLDFALKIGAVDVHLGGLLGLLGNINKGSDRIQDNSTSLTFSFDMKGS